MLRSFLLVFILLSGTALICDFAIAQKAQTSATPSTPTEDPLDEIVVHGIRRGELILPTTETSSSAYGLDLGVMDTPRNNTVLTHAQLDALNINNPQESSYMTSSSYSDSSFGTIRITATIS